MVRRAFGSLAGGEAGEQEAAWERAEALLRDSVTPKQYASYEASGYLEIPSRSYPGRVYRVDGWRPVAVFEHGQFVGAICIRPREHLPGPDIVLARKLLIEGAEEEFLRSGNWLSPAWRPASAAPTMLLILIVLSPWLVHLQQLGVPGMAGGAVALLLPLLVIWRRWRGGRRRPEGDDNREEPARGEA